MSPQQTAAAALTSLLNSLHTHLQAQTQLLPTLYAQLGLPATALEDELKILQQQLVQNIELQIDRRREEVDAWIEKCDELEQQCLRYTTALGGNVKATGSSLAELKKEQALPRRYEAIAEHQEKLRQVYHTKLEQLYALTNRINALAKTLGVDYFPFDVCEPTVVSGQDTQDPNATRDVTPERFMRLEKELVRGKAEISKRLNRLFKTLVQVDWLYAELGISPPSTDVAASSPAAEPHPAFAPAVALLDDPFSVSTPTPASKSTVFPALLLRNSAPIAPEVDHQRILAAFMAKMAEVDVESLPESQTTPIGLENVEPSPSLLSWADNLCASLEDTKRRREAHIQAMYDQLEPLWRRMGVADEDMDAFVEAHKGSTQETIQEYEDELERMLELKREKMGTFVENARHEIIKLWDELMIGEDERADFAPFADDEFTEELLAIHEDEIRRLKEEKRQKAPLLANIKKYFDICDEEKELATAASDQSRLTGRGPRDPGRLLREEKMRKRVQKEKPRLERELLVAIPAWEGQSGRPFLVLGQSILQLLLETVSAQDQENKRKPGRSGSVPPRAKTPVDTSRPNNGRSGVVTPAVRTNPHAPAHSVPNKRQRIGDNSSSTSTHGSIARPPLGTHKGVNISGSTRSSSPAKMISKTPGSSTSSLPRPRPATIGMVMPKPGTQHHALGHGRVPSTVIYGAGVGGSSTRSSSIQSNSSRHPSGTTAKKVTKRESFRPRPSIDAMESRAMTTTGVLGASGRWGGGAFSGLREEDED